MRISARFLLKKGIEVTVLGRFTLVAVAVLVCATGYSAEEPAAPVPQTAKVDAPAPIAPSTEPAAKPASVAPPPKTEAVPTPVPAPVVTAHAKEPSSPASPAAVSQNNPLVVVRADGKGPDSQATEGHDYSRANLIVDWTAAIFGILSIAFSILALILGFLGYSTYKELKERFARDMTEMKERFSRETTEQKERFARETSATIEAMEKQVNSIATKQIEEIIASRFRPLAQDVVENARTTLHEEIQRYVKEPEWRTELVEEIQAGVIEKMTQKPSATKVDEFENGKNT